MLSCNIMINHVKLFVWSVLAQDGCLYVLYWAPVIVCLCRVALQVIVFLCRVALQVIVCLCHVGSKSLFVP